MAINSSLSIGQLELAPQIVDQSFNREPFGFDHNLSKLDIFELGSLGKLAEKYHGHEQDYFLASSAAAPDEKFRAVKPVILDLSEAFRPLSQQSIRILLKRPENHDPKFRKLLDGLIDQISDQSGDLINTPIFLL